MICWLNWQRPLNVFVGLSIVTGGLSGGIASYGGSFIKDLAWGYKFAGRTAIGGITGGITHSLYGDNFWKGFVRGAETAAAAFLFNETAHWFQEMVKSLKCGVGAAGIVVWEGKKSAAEHAVFNLLGAKAELPVAAELAIEHGRLGWEAYRNISHWNDWAEDIGNRIEDWCSMFK